MGKITLHVCERDYRHPSSSTGDWIQDIAHFHPHPIPPNLPPLLCVTANTQIYGCSSLINMHNKSLVQLALHTHLLVPLVGGVGDSVLAAYLWCLQAILSQTGGRMRLGNDLDILTIPGFSGVP